MTFLNSTYEQSKMTNQTFEPDYYTLSVSGVEDEKINKLQNYVEEIRDLLVFDDETEETIGLVSGGFTHNCIGLTLACISDLFDKSLANKVLLGFSLEDFGWKPVQE